MNDHYFQNDAAKKSFFRKGLIALLVLAAVSTVFMTRYALSGSRNSFSGDAPNYDDAYLMAKTFVKPTLKSAKISFPESGYQCAQKPDSIFIVKSYAEAKDHAGPDSITTFEITLKFNGGKVNDKNSWKVLNMVED